MTPVRIAFYGLFGQGNLGNECTLQAILHHARRYFPEARFTCICTGPDDVTARHAIPAIPISRRYLRSAHSRARPRSGRRTAAWLRSAFVGIPRELLDWVRALKALGDTHLLVVPGTGFLTDANSSPLGSPYDIFKWSLVARLCRCRLLYVGIGAGPIYHALSRRFITSALALAHFRSYRDGDTMEYLEGLGFSREGDRVCPDLAFSLPAAWLPQAAARRSQRRVVGIGLMDAPGKLSTDKPGSATHEAYLRKLATFTRWLLAHEYEVRLLIGDFAYDGTVARDFRDLLKDDRAAYDQGRVVDTPALSVEQLLAQLASTDIVVATRFHNVLLALMLDKPVISVSFHPKCVSLMRGLGLSEYMQDIGDLEVDRLIRQLRDLEKNAESLRASTRQKVEQYRKDLDEQYSLIFGDLGAQARGRRRTGMDHGTERR